MADHPDITPEELAKALEVYLATASFTKAAAAIGRDRTSTRRALQRSVEPVRAQVYARSLDEVLARAAALQRTAVRTLRPGVRVGDPKAVAALNDTARTASVTRTAQAKLSGTHAPEKIETTHDVRESLAAQLARLAGSADPDEAGGAGGEPDGE